MSNEAINWALEQELKAPEKPILVILANRADKQGKCYPSHARIARDSGYCTTTVRNALSRLKAAGLLDWCNTRKEDGKSLSSNLYHLLMHPTAGDAAPLHHEKEHLTARDVQPSIATRLSPTSGDGEKPKEEPTLKPKKNREPWMIRKELEQIDDSIAKIKKDPANQDGWVTNNNTQGGYPILKEEAKLRIEQLKEKKILLEVESEQALLEN